MWFLFGYFSFWCLVLVRVRSSLYVCIEKIELFFHRHLTAALIRSALISFHFAYIEWNEHILIDDDHKLNWIYRGTTKLSRWDNCGHCERREKNHIATKTISSIESHTCVKWEKKEKKTKIEIPKCEETWTILPNKQSCNTSDISNIDWYIGSERAWKPHFIRLIWAVFYVY